MAIFGDFANTLVRKNGQRWPTWEVKMKGPKKLQMQVYTAKNALKNHYRIKVKTPDYTLLWGVPS